MVCRSVVEASKGQSLWIGETKWVVSELKECNIGGGRKRKSSKRKIGTRVVVLSHFLSPHTKWGACQEDERSRGPKPSGQKDKIQDCGKGWSYSGKSVEKIKSVVSWKLRTNWLFSLPRREGGHLLERGGHLHPLLPRVWRRNCSIFWWIWTKWLQQREGAFWKETRKRWGQFCPLAALSSPPSRTRGCQLHHEGDRKLQRALRSPNNGESPDFQLQRASPYE